MIAHRLFFASFAACLLLSIVTADKKYAGKYSKEANEKKTFLDTQPEIKDLHRPFRMAKLNLVWTKAQSRLTEAKLKSLYLELSIYDKEALVLKHNEQLKNKDQKKVDEMRHKLVGIMSTYDLLEHFDETEDHEKVKEYRKTSTHEKAGKYGEKRLFKDKKLNKLWEKAEHAGFTPEELRNLKEELQHHEDKVDVYQSLLETFGSTKSDKHENAIDTEDLDVYNEVGNDPNDNNINTHEMNLKKYESNINKLREHHQDIKQHYDRLERRVSAGPQSQDFIEPKVQGLWRVALASNFTDKELNSIKSELHHFEGRLMKLRNLHTEHAIMKEKYKDGKHKDKTNRFDDMEEHIQKQTRKLQKIQEDVERTVFKHSEL